MSVTSALVPLLAITTACAENSPVNDPNLTKQAGIAQTLEHLERTEAALPEGMVLAAQSDHPDAVERTFFSGSISCGGLGAANLDTAPQLVYMSYFVNGAPDGESRKYVTRIRQSWESWGWKLAAEPDEQRAVYINDDGYVLDVQVSVEGSISVGAETPCIAAENFTGTEEVPRRIGGV